MTTSSDAAADHTQAASSNDAEPHEMCPDGCGRTTDYPGQCSECWAATTSRSQTAQDCFSLGHEWEFVGGGEGLQCARCLITEAEAEG